MHIYIEKIYTFALSKIFYCSISLQYAIFNIGQYIHRWIVGEFLRIVFMVILTWFFGERLVLQFYYLTICWQECYTF